MNWGKDAAGPVFIAGKLNFSACNSRLICPSKTVAHSVFERTDSYYRIQKIAEVKKSIGGHLLLNYAYQLAEFDPPRRSLLPQASRRTVHDRRINLTPDSHHTFRKIRAVAFPVFRVRLHMSRNIPLNRRCTDDAVHQGST